MKDKIIDQLSRLRNNLTNSELETKINIIHKLIDQTNNSIRRQNYINAKYVTPKSKPDEKDSSNSTNKIKKHVEKNKANNTPNKIESKHVK